MKIGGVFFNIDQCDSVSQISKNFDKSQLRINNLRPGPDRCKMIAIGLTLSMKARARYVGSIEDHDILR